MLDETDLNQLKGRTAERHDLDGPMTMAEVLGERPEVIDRVVALARERRPGDELFASFIVEYYAELLEFDVDERPAEDLYAAAANHYALGRVRSPGATRIRVFTPDRERDGWFADRSVVMIVTDDAPFLVDTVRIVLDEAKAEIHLMVHPMLWVRRDESDHIVDVGIAAEDDAREVEAWTQVEIDACTPERAEELRIAVEQAVARVHAAVAAFEPMQERMCSFADIDPLLRWLADRHFVFLASAVFERGADGEPVLVDGSVLGDAAGLDPYDPEIDWDGHTITIGRSQRESRVHRQARLTVITVLRRTDDERLQAVRFVGLLASSAYRQSVLTIPTVGDRARQVLGLAHAGAETHTGRSMRNVLETLPREVVFELDTDQLAQLVLDVVGLHERRIVRIFDVPEPVDSSSTILVYLPKRRFHARLPEMVAAVVGEAYRSPVRDLESFLGSSNLARVTFTVRRSDEAPDLDALSDEIDELTTAWIERVHDAAADRLGDVAAGRLIRRLGSAAPDEYVSTVAPAAAVGDFQRIVELLDGEESSLTALVHDVDADPGVWRIRVYHRDPIALADLLPILGHLGLRALDEHPYHFELDDRSCYLYDIGVRLPDGVEIDELRHRELRRALDALLSGREDSDGFDRLVLLAGLTVEQANILRSYARYTHQIGFTFSRGYIEETFARLPALARGLVDLFEERFDPGREPLERPERVEQLAGAVSSLLDGVPSLDDDRIGRMFLAIVMATVRTNHFVDTPTLALKLDPTLVPDLPEPHPAHEIFVSSPRVEGVHLRAGPIARGGLRWSDRPEDYRTEILGLVKAQMVKNAVIVPVGAKGGFIVKKPPVEPADVRAEGVACYRLFISALLDVTDNIVDGRVVAPADVVRYDGDDPYLVVAADKGTATFSDVANEIADDYGFWLGDAFASGGSEGYDHKEMGITARGAWESVRRHARVLGKNADTDVLTVVGIGDMSGDVFGNGMLCSEHLELVGAFDHRHVFIDPNPDPAVSYAERRRMFELPRSSWADYDTDKLSAGGGIYPRSLKSIDPSPEARRALGLDIDRDTYTPDELISAMLRAPVDLLWNGGIGTYVKASTESHGDVGDRANDTVRVDGDQLRCRMVGEGGNLGVTQLGRIEYGLHGGLIYTDAIDNSAGVDCSDHVDNIKILPGDVVADGELTLKQRNELLHAMTDEVADLVLADNKAQTLALLIARHQGLRMVNVHARYLEQLESEGRIDRGLEFLPTDKQMAERQANDSGLRAPELAVLIAYTKNAGAAEILETDLPDDPALEEDLLLYFPEPLRERYGKHVLGHRLRREIVATAVVNQMVNLSGISYAHRMTEDTSASVADVARAWVVARDTLDFDQVWAELTDLDHMALGDQLDLYLDCRRMAERCSMWFLRQRRPPIDISAEVAHFRPSVQALAELLPDHLRGPIGDAAAALVQQRVEGGVPADLARRSSAWRLMHTTFDVIELADRIGADAIDVSVVYWDVFDRFEMLWLWDGIGALPRVDRWQTQARGALRDNLLATLIELTENVFEHGSVDAWMAANDRSFDRAIQQLTDVRRSDSFGITNLTVALRQLRNLAQTSVRDV